MDHQYDGAWYGVQKGTIVGMVRKTRKKLGFGDEIGTVEKTYAGMKIPIIAFCSAVHGFLIRWNQPMLCG